MAESRDFERVAGPSLRRRDNLIQLLAIGLVAAGVGAAVAYFFLRAADSGDEPPIRVKNGSIQFHVLGDDKWHPKNKGQADEYWVMKKDKPRSYDTVQITAAYDGAVYQGQPCKVTASGDAVIIVYRDPDGTETRVTVRSTDKRTRITAGTPGRLSGEDKKLLEYSGNGFISRIAVESSSTEQTLCEFSSKAQLTHLLLLDYQD